MENFLVGAAVAIISYYFGYRHGKITSYSRIAQLQAAGQFVTNLLYNIITEIPVDILQRSVNVAENESQIDLDEFHQAQEFLNKCKENLAKHRKISNFVGQQKTEACETD